jgi:hypothetical protein
MRDRDGHAAFVNIQEGGKLPAKDIVRLEQRKRTRGNVERMKESGVMLPVELGVSLAPIAPKDLVYHDRSTCCVDSSC